MRNDNLPTTEEVTAMIAEALAPVDEKFVDRHGRIRYLSCLFNHLLIVGHSAGITPDDLRHYLEKVKPTVISTPFAQS